MAEAVLAVGAVIGAFSSIKQMGAAKKAAKQEKKRAEGAQRQTQVEAEQARRRSLRERMIAQGQVLNQGANSGVGLGGTSGVQGALSSVGSQFATNVGNINVREGSAISMANTQTNINEATNKANQWGQITSLGMSAMSNASAIGQGYNSIFKSTPKTA